MKSLWWIGCVGLFVGACADDGTAGDNLTLSFTDLPVLGDGFVYEGWLVTPDDVVSSGRFTVDATGALSESIFAVDTAVAQATTTFVLTIEPEVGDDPAPSSTHLVAGDFVADEAALTIDHMAALGTDFESAEGEYILATPSSAADDDTQGIWWLVPPTPSAGLTLPTLPAGWAYEGWVVDDDGPISTGRFTDAEAVDSDGAGPDAGTDGCTVDTLCPGFPGQDFIDPALDLVGLTTVISVEPDPDDSALPFALKPLIHAGIADVARPTTQAMDNMASVGRPTGSATLNTP